MPVFLQVAYKLLNSTQNCGELKQLQPNANRPLPSRPPPKPLEPFQPTETNQNKLKIMNAPSLEKTSSAIPTVPNRSGNSEDTRLTTYENLPLIMDPTSPFINACSINNTVSLSPPSIISTNQPYVNLSPFNYSSNTNFSYSYSNTFFPIPLNFVFSSSEQIASDIIHFLVQASPHASPNNLQLVVFENMLIKHYKPSLISHINLLLLAFQIVTIQHLKQSFAAVSHISDFVKYSSTI